MVGLSGAPALGARGLRHKAARPHQLWRSALNVNRFDRVHHGRAIRMIPRAVARGIARIISRAIEAKSSSQLPHVISRSKK
jgi:hypothetical protein